MLYLIIYIISIFLIFIFLLILCIYVISNLVAGLMGAIFLPTKQQEVDFILKNANLKKGQTFIDLGSGDGRVVRTAVKSCQVKGIGIEINPLLLLYSRVLSRMQKLKDTHFKIESLFKTDIKTADVIFLFLMPNTVNKLKNKFFKESKKNALIISHGFKIEGWEKFLLKTIPHVPFPTYYYSLH